MLRAEGGASVDITVLLGTIKDRAFFDLASNDREDDPGRMRSLDDFTRSDHVMSLPSPHSGSFTFIPALVLPVERPCLAGEAPDAAGEDNGAGLKTARAKSLKDEGMTAALFGVTGFDLFTAEKIRPRTVLDVCEVDVGRCFVSGIQRRTSSIATIASRPLKKVELAFPNSGRNEERCTQ
jgi:hypothetical protein